MLIYLFVYHPTPAPKPSSCSKKYAPKRKSYALFFAFTEPRISSALHRELNVQISWDSTEDVTLDLTFLFPHYNSITSASVSQYTISSVSPLTPSPARLAVPSSFEELHVRAENASHRLLHPAWRLPLFHRQGHSWEPYTQPGVVSMRSPLTNDRQGPVDQYFLLRKMGLRYISLDPSHSPGGIEFVGRDNMKTHPCFGDPFFTPLCSASWLHGIPSQRNYLHTSLYLRVCFMRNLPEKNRCFIHY